MGCRCEAPRLSHCRRLGGPDIGIQFLALDHVSKLAETVWGRRRGGDGVRINLS
jgi:hypothetical protein